MKTQTMHTKLMSINLEANRPKCKSLHFLVIYASTLNFYLTETSRKKKPCVDLCLKFMTDLN